jgi:hypothetical protein
MNLSPTETELIGRSEMVDGGFGLMQRASGLNG